MSNARRLVLKIAQSLARELALSRELDLAVDLDLDFAFELAKGLIHTALDLDLDVVRHLLHDLDVAVARAYARAHDHDHDRTLALDLALDITRVLVAELKGAQSPARHEGVFIRVSPPAARLADTAAKLLPRAERFRYAEEYHSELHELARISRRAQWAYAVRLLGWAPSLRRELRRDANEAVPGR